MRTFEELVLSAFTKRYNFGTRINKAKYRTQPLEAKLGEIFGEDALFAGVPKDRINSYHRKVAVTSTTETGEQAVIFANYNRTNDTQGTGASLR